MSVQFDQQVANEPITLEAVYPEPNQPGGKRLTGSPVSVTLWVYFEAVPTGTETVWWFGEAGASNGLVLEAVANGQSVDLNASLVGQSTLGPATQAGLATGAWHCVSVVLTALQSGYTVTAYADDASGVATSGNGTGVDLTLWDTFALARNRSGGAANPGSFFCEQVAIWDDKLEPLDTANMYQQRIPPVDGGSLLVGKAPDFGYWYACGHTRIGLVVTRGRTWPEFGGELYNEASPDFAPPSERLPQLRVPSDGFEPVWRGLTPGMLYATDVVLTPVDRVPPNEPSRLQPNFYFTNGPQTFAGQAIDPTPEQVRELAYFSDPNMSAYSGADAGAANSGINPPYVTQDDTTYLPVRDIAQIARRVADWFEIQNFKAGTGAGPGRNYAGAVWLRAIGDGGLVKDTTQLLGYVGPPFDREVPDNAVLKISGRGGGIPLQQHPEDWVLLDTKPRIEAPWACWYRETGTAVVKEYMDSFWLALKQQLDDRGLCYPLRAHFDYELWPRDTEMLKMLKGFPGAETSQVGSWQDTYDDDRSGKDAPTTPGEDILNYSGSTIEALLTDPELVPTSPHKVTWNNADNMYSGPNNIFQQWWNGVSVMARMQAMSESIVDTLKDVFPYCQWSNYRTFVADNPAFKHINSKDFGTNQRWFNTPINNPDLDPPADFSAPMLYTNRNQLDNMRGDYDERIGYTFSEVVRDQETTRVDASANAIAYRPLSPHIEDVGRVLERRDDGEVVYSYRITVEDSKALLSHLWQRGCDEYIMFAYNTAFESYAGKIEACQWLRDWVHSIPQARQDRVGRVSRLGRRGM